jgi:cyclopropane-fatty-acyl-phospholipid synthase
LPRAFAPLRHLPRRLVLRLLRGWRHGSLELHLPDGERIVVGDARATERAVCVVRDESFFTNVLLRGEMGAGESFVEGHWDSPDLVALLSLFRRNLDSLDFETPLSWLGRLPKLVEHRLRHNSAARSQDNIHAHYDLGNQLYRLFLDPTMTYSAGLYLTPDDSLEQAQHNKLDRLFDLLELGPDDHLLDIGCGWGGLAVRAASTRGCKVTGITISREQLELARQRVAGAGLADRVSIEYCDYREASGTYDKIVSVEMLEAVGLEYLGRYFRTCERLLAPGGKVAIQSIVMPDERFDAYSKNVDWTQAYIFPGSLIPSLHAIERAVATTSLRIEHTDDIGPHYAPTLEAWRQRFVDNLAEVQALGYDQRFERIWLLYLCWSEIQFAERKLQDLHIVLG